MHRRREREGYRHSTFLSLSISSSLFKVRHLPSLNTILFSHHAWKMWLYAWTYNKNGSYSLKWTSNDIHSLTYRREKNRRMGNFLIDREKKNCINMFNNKSTYIDFILSLSVFCTILLWILYEWPASIRLS